MDREIARQNVFLFLKKSNLMFVFSFFILCVVISDVAEVFLSRNSLMQKLEAVCDVVCEAHDLQGPAPGSADVAR